MENKRAVILIATAIATLTPAWLFAYEPHSTHRALTREICEFYNFHAEESGGTALREEDCLAMEKGAMDEDNDYRMAHHFYDPIYGRGLKEYKSSKSWAEDPMYQANWDIAIPGNRLVTALFEGENDHSWQRAVYDFVYRDRESAMRSLGHTLHLIEDASVPDHTRNDAHIPIFDDAIARYIGEEYRQHSPFEAYTDRFSVEAGNVRAADELHADGVRIKEHVRLGDIFDSAATYSNTNFFSNSTIFSPDYSLPLLQSTTTVRLLSGEEKTFGEYNEHYIVQIDYKLSQSGADEFDYTIEDMDLRILSSYWSLTSRSAVEHGAATVAFFFREVEKERETGALRKMKDPLLVQAGVGTIKGVGRIGQAGSRFITLAITEVGHAGAFAARGVTFALEGTFGPASGSLADTNIALSVEENTPSENRAAPEHTDPPLAATSAAPIDIAELYRELLTAERDLRALLASTKGIARAEIAPPGEVLGASDTIPSIPRLSGSAGGGLGGVIILASLDGGSSPIPPAPTLDPDTSATATPIDITLPDAPIVLDPAESVSTHATSTIDFAGTAEASSTILASFAADAATYLISTSANESGEWGMTLLLAEGTTTISFAARDLAGNISSSTVRTVVVAFPMEAPVSIVAPGEILLSEIMWGPTDPENEWVELYNASTSPIDLSGLTLRTEDGGMEIALDGSIPPRGFVLVSRLREDGRSALLVPVPAITRSFGAGLDDAGESLSIVRHDGTVIDHFPLCANWCGKGGGTHGLSVERHRFDLPTDDWGHNWGVNIGFLGGSAPLLANGSDTSGPLAATPGMRNSANYLFALGGTLTGTYAPVAALYVVPGVGPTFVPTGSALTLAPGTAVKFLHDVGAIGDDGISINGTFRAEGTPEEPIVFTSIDNDAVYGDTAANGTTTIVRSGWVGGGSGADVAFSFVEFSHMRSGLSFIESFEVTNATFTDVGTALSIIDGGILTASHITMENVDRGISAQLGGSFELSSSTIMNTGSGIHLSGSEGAATSSITDSLITGSSENGISLFHGAILEISSSTITSGDAHGVSSSYGSAAVISGSTITENAGCGIYLNAGTAEVSDSVLSGNGEEGAPCGIFPPVPPADDTPGEEPPPSDTPPDEPPPDDMVWTD